MDTQTDEKMQVTTLVSSDEVVPVQAMSFDPTHDPIYGVDTKPADETDCGTFKCPHCGHEYDEGDLEGMDQFTKELHIIKDSCYSEASGSCTTIYRCENCGGTFTIDWDWDF